MRVLILSAILACAAAAPSGAILSTIPIAIPGIPSSIPAIPSIPSSIPAIPAIPASIPAFPAISTLPAIPTISPGDLQAAAINAKVEAEDFIQATADRNRETAEQILETSSDKTLEAANLANEKNQEAFWQVEDKKWQALTALQSAQANIDGLMASNSELLGQAILNVPASGTPVAPVAYGAAAVKTEEKAEEKTEEKKEEAMVKTGAVETEQRDSVAVEAAKDETAAALKTAVTEAPQAPAENTMAKGSEAVAPILAPISYPTLLAAAPLAGLPINLNTYPWQTTFIQPGLKLIAPQTALIQDGVVTAVASKASW